MLKFNKTFALADSEGSPDRAQGSMVIAHSTANPDTTARNNAAYEKRTYNTAYVHFIVDDTAIYQVGEPGYVAWGCGPNGNPLSPVQIELCEFSDHKKALAAYKNYIDLIKWAIAKYGCEKSLDSQNRSSGVKTHRWVSRNLGGTDHTDPVDYLASIGVTLGQFEKDIKGTVAVSAQVHNVRKGETLWGLAKKYHTTVSNIMAKNGLKSSVLHIGQMLKI